MTTLSADARRAFRLGVIAEHGVIAADVIYEGAAVGDNASGYARPLEAGDPFLGFAEEQADNATGSAGDRRVRCITRGAIELDISGLALTDLGADVYASDDDTFTLTQGSNTRIGYVEQFIESGKGVVRFEAVRSAIAELTDSSGGTASDTIAAITGANNAGSADETPTENAIASLTAKVNEIVRRLGA